MKTEQRHLTLSTSTKRTIEVIDSNGHRYWEQYKVENPYTKPGVFTFFRKITDINKRHIFI